MHESRSTHCLSKGPGVVLILVSVPGNHSFVRYQEQDVGPEIGKTIIQSVYQCLSKLEYGSISQDSVIIVLIVEHRWSMIVYQ